MRTFFLSGVIGNFSRWLLPYILGMESPFLLVYLPPCVVVFLGRRRRRRRGEEVGDLGVVEVKIGSTNARFFFLPFSSSSGV